MGIHPHPCYYVDIPLPSGNTIDLANADEASVDAIFQEAVDIVDVILSDAKGITEAGWNVPLEGDFFEANFKFEGRKWVAHVYLYPDLYEIGQQTNRPVVLLLDYYDPQHTYRDSDPQSKERLKEVVAEALPDIDDIQTYEGTHYY